MTDKPNIEALSREFRELAGIEFAEYWWCPKCQEEISPARVTFDEKCDTCMNHVEWKEMPDLSDAREVLKVMRKRADWNGTFVYHIGGEVHAGSNYKIPQELIPIDYILDTTGLLLKEAVEWLKGRER